MQKQIEDKIKEFQIYLDTLLPDVKTDIVVIENSDQVIPETGMSGEYKSDGIYIYFDSKSENLKTNLDKEVKRSFSHEYMHAYREKFAKWDSDNTYECLFAEGLTQNFEQEAFPELMPASYSVSVSESEQLKILKRINDGEKFNYYDLFFGNEELGIPWWTGYSLSYGLVNKFCGSQNRKPSQVANDNLSEFISFCKKVSV